MSYSTQKKYQFRYIANPIIICPFWFFLFYFLNILEPGQEGTTLCIIRTRNSSPFKKSYYCLFYILSYDFYYVNHNHTIIRFQKKKSKLVVLWMFSIHVTNKGKISTSLTLCFHQLTEFLHIDHSWFRS